MKNKTKEIWIVGGGITALIALGVIYKVWYKANTKPSNTKSPTEPPPLTSSKTSDFHYTNTQQIGSINVTNNNVAVHVAPSDNTVVQQKELDTLKQELSHSSDRIKKLEDLNKLLEGRLAQLEHKEQALADKTTQRFVNLTQYTFTAHLENAASVAAGKAEKGQDEATLRTYYYREALQDAEKLAVEMDIPELADSYAQQRVDMLGSDSLD